MIVFLCGKDSYRLKQDLDMIIEEYKTKHASGMSFSVLDASDGAANNTLEKLENLVKTTSFFNEKRLVVIKNPFLINNGLSSLIKKWGLIEDKERIVICIEFENGGELEKKDKGLYALLAAKTNTVKSFEPLDGKRLENWIVKEVSRLGKKIGPERGREDSRRASASYGIDPAAVQQLISRTGGDSWLLGQEINKLVNYKSTLDKDAITAADVDLLVAPKEGLNIFGIVDAVANRNRLHAAKLIHDHLESGADPYYIFSMLIYQFRNLLRIKDLAKSAAPYSDIVKQTGLKPFVARKIYEQCKKYDLNELKTLFSKLADLDLMAKNGEVELADSLYKFVFSI